jgi:hypothetical protein
MLISRPLPTFWRAVRLLPPVEPDACLAAIRRRLWGSCSGNWVGCHAPLPPDSADRCLRWACRVGGRVGPYGIHRAGGPEWTCPRCARALAPGIRWRRPGHCGLLGDFSAALDSSNSPRANHVLSLGYLGMEPATVVVRARVLLSARGWSLGHWAHHPRCRGGRRRGRSGASFGPPHLPTAGSSLRLELILGPFSARACHGRGPRGCLRPAPIPSCATSRGRPSVGSASRAPRSARGK